MQSLKQWLLISRLVRNVLPAVEKELHGWEKYLQTCPSPFLKKQALQSMKTKRFHCQGGAALALLYPAATEKLIPLIVSYQTISDYLDNLCDRISFLRDTPYLLEQEKDSLREKGFRYLHLSLFGALQPHNGESKDYYRFYPIKEDGGYLDNLVNESRKTLCKLPGYRAVKDRLLLLAALYCDIQALKHLSAGNRSRYLIEWFRPYASAFPNLHWNEFAAAAGSTLGIFALLSSASRKEITPDEVEAVFNGYFPWICGLHILLDYFIDQEEDQREDDLNFISCYPGKEQCLDRMEEFVKKALDRTEKMPDPVFHRTLVKGLLALYLSDPKIPGQGLYKSACRLLAATGEKDTYLMFYACRLLRKRKLI